MELTGYISPVIGLMCLVAVALIWKKGNGHTPRLTFVLYAVGVFCIVATPIGRWVKSMLDQANNLVGSAAGQLLGISVVGVITLIVAGAAIYCSVIDFRQRKFNKWTVVTVGVSMLLLGALPGVLGQASRGAMETASGGVGRLVSAAFGVG